MCSVTFLQVAKWPTPELKTSSMKVGPEFELHDDK